MLETLRAFIALNLEIGATRRLGVLQRSLRTSHEAPTSRVAWVSPANLHLTLRCLGHMDQALAPAVGDALREIVAACAPMRVQLNNLSAFPRQDHARLLLVNAKEPSGALAKLAEDVEALAQRFGFPADDRPFHAHVILGRMAEPVDVTRWFASLGRSDLADAQVSECVLYHDLVDNPGAEFSALQRLALRVPASGRSNRPRSGHPSQRPKSRSKPPRETASAPRDDQIPPPPKVPNLDPGDQGGDS